GRADNGNFVLSELKIEANGKPVELKSAVADFSQGGWSAPEVLDKKPQSGWAIMPEFGKPHQITVETATPIGVAAAAGAESPEVTLVVRLEHQSPHASHVLGRFRLSATTAPPSMWKGAPDKLRDILAKPADKRTDAERKELTDSFFASRSDVSTARAQADAAKKAREQAEKEVPTTMVMRERDQPRTTSILVRGAWDKPGDKVTHGVPSALPPLPPDAPSNRLALARWLMAPEHPLTARVTVNRYWQLFLGSGLVRTSEDFGVQGEKPSHPELLDWLASEFREPTVPQPTVLQPTVAQAAAVSSAPQSSDAASARNTWNVKHVHRLIVTSAAYRQSSKVTAMLLERDPENRLLARGPRYRWPSWMLRDQALAASGLLVEKLGGRPVKGYQPPGIWEDATFGQIRYEQEHGEALYRRSVYQFWRRIVGPTVFFDVANRQTCTVKLARTNTPLHALVTLNDVTYVEAAR
ncbi:MAG TPA: DUF1553 domain-containing protein, partial [Pirellulaceae bacterium]|nr:DUF1553 domain-containing protein [Pirellulaceae bacterium]